jgi:Reverse transcriptase (RNA-dependent DNA polymerase)
MVRFPVHGIPEKTGPNRTAATLIIDQLVLVDNDEFHTPITVTPDSMPPALADFINNNIVICTISDDTAVDPNSVKDARNSVYWNKWLGTMQEELASLKAKSVYEPVHTLPASRRAVQHKWVLHIKHDKTNTISRFKARLVAKGFTQIPGQDFNYTFVPVARWDSIRTVLSLATVHDYELRQLDIKTAYLNGPLDEEIYMHVPPGSDTPYWRLHKGLYGLRQAGRQWYLTLHETYSDLNYTRCKSDWSVYMHNIGKTVTISATSVDDILLATNSKEASDVAASELHSKFTVTDAGDAEWLLGCRITCWRDKCVLKLDQEQFVIRILCEFRMEFCNSTVMPCPKWRLTSDMCPSSDTERQNTSCLPYCAVVGKCMYLSTCTCPNISYTVRELARFMSNYGEKHFEAAKHLLCYLQGTRCRGLVYGNTPSTYPIFCAFADSDWAMSEGHCSVSGFVIECGGAPVAWSSKQQAIVALSLCEAEYLSCMHCVRHIIWFCSLFQELGFNQKQPTVLYCDNKGTVVCMHDPHSHSQMKHIDIRAHFICDCVNKELIDVHHIPGTENPSDLLTKPLNKFIHEKWLTTLRLDTGQGGVSVDP